MSGVPINKIVDKDGDQQLLVTFSLLLIIQFTAFGLWGPGSRRIDTPHASSSVALGPFGLNEAKLIAFVFSPGMALATILFVRYTELGSAIRSTASNPTIAEYTGIPKEKMYQSRPAWESR